MKRVLITGAGAGRKKLKPDPIGDYFEGGLFCNSEFAARPGDFEA